MSSSARRFLVLVAALAVAAAVLAAPALARNEIAYRCDLDICLLDPASPAAVTNLTANGAKTYDEEPVWSPDGNRVAFVSREPTTVQNIFTMQPDAPGQGNNIAVALTHYTENGFISEVRWSPDGSRIAYERELGGFRQIFVVAADGSTLTPLPIAAPGEYPTWAPDGGKIAFSKGSEQVYTTNADGSNAIAPVPNALGQRPVWSPDGSFIAYEHGKPGSFNDVNVLPLNGGPAAVLPAEFAQWTYSSWSPNGTRIAYRSQALSPVTGEFEYFLRVANRDGSGNIPLPALGGANVYNYRPSWSPDGTRLVFEARTHGPLPEGQEIFVQSADGTGQMQQITSGGKNYEPDWRVNPLVSPLVPVITPSNGRAGQPPGGRKPELRWFTNRAPITGNGPVHVMIVACGAPDCGANTTGKAKASHARGLSFRPASVSKKKKPSLVVVGKGKLRLVEGQKKTLDMYLNKAGQALLRKRGKLEIETTVTVTGTGQAPVTSKRTIQVVLAKPKPKKKR